MSDRGDLILRLKRMANDPDMWATDRKTAQEALDALTGEVKSEDEVSPQGRKATTTLVLDGYQRDNLLACLMAIWTCGPGHPFGALNTGDWNGELLWNLGAVYRNGVIDVDLSQANHTPEEMIHDAITLAAINPPRPDRSDG